MLEPCGEDERRELWLKADRGAPKDFHDYEELREDGDVFVLGKWYVAYMPV